MKGFYVVTILNSLNLHPSHHHLIVQLMEVFLHLLCRPLLYPELFWIKISSVSEGTDIPLLPNHLHHQGNHPLDCPNSTLAVKYIYIFCHLGLRA